MGPTRKRVLLRPHRHGPHRAQSAPVPRGPRPARSHPRPAGPDHSPPAVDAHGGGGGEPGVQDIDAAEGRGVPQRFLQRRVVVEPQPAAEPVHGATQGRRRAQRGRSRRRHRRRPSSGAAPPLRVTGARGDSQSARRGGRRGRCAALQRPRPQLPPAGRRRPKPPRKCRCHPQRATPQFSQQGGSPQGNVRNLHSNKKRKKTPKYFQRPPNGSLPASKRYLRP